MKASPRPSLIVIALALILGACGQSETPPAAPPPPTPVTTEPPVRLMNDGAADLEQQRRQWRQALQMLLQAPTTPHLHAARQQWRTLYEAFNRAYLSLAARACASDRATVLERLDHWPWYPAYVDALPAWPDSGLINDPTLTLDASSLRAQHGATDDGEVALGFQPLWLMLAGAPGAPRHITDLQPEPEHHGERRREYLRLAAAQLESDLTALAAEQTLNPADLRCALGMIDQRLERRRDYQDATDPAGGLYFDAHSGEIIDAVQPTAALDQLATDGNAALRARLEQLEPGFQEALDQARRDQDWAPLAAWLTPTAP